MTRNWKKNGSKFAIIDSYMFPFALDNALAAVAEYTGGKHIPITLVLYKERDPKGFWPAFSVNGQKVMDEAERRLERNVARAHDLAHAPSKVSLDGDILHVERPPRFFSKIEFPGAGLNYDLHVASIGNVNVYAGTPHLVVPYMQDADAKALAIEAILAEALGESEAAAKDLSAGQKLAQKLVQVGCSAGGPNSVALKAQKIPRNELWST